jgi:hypothetical protein
MNQEYIKKIDDAFLFSRERYESLKSELEASNAFNFAQARYDYFHNPIPRIQLLLTQLMRWRKQRLLKDEIDSNVTSLNHFRQVRKLYLDRQYLLISSFTKALPLYFNNLDRYNHLIEALHSLDGPRLTKIDFILAIELYYISIFDLVENSIYQYDPDYKRRLDKDDYSVLKENTFISLDYGSENDTIISSLFQLLKGKEIKCTFEEFEALFKPGNFGNTKVTWHATEPKLTILLKGNFDTQGGLKTRNEDVLQVAVERFISKKGLPFNLAQLRTVAIQSHMSVSVGNSEKIIKFLKKHNN